MQGKLLGALVLGALLAACSSDSDTGSGTITGLAVVDQVTLVEAQNSGSTARILPPGVRAAGGTSYSSAVTRFWVRDDSMEALDTVNTILCSIQQTGYADPAVLNQGPYLALVACEDRGGGGGNRGQNGTEYQRFVVDSSRQSLGSPHIVKFWIEQVDNGQPSIIYGQITITEAPSDENPNGAFELFFKGLAASEPATSTNYLFKGYLRTVARTDSQIEFEFYNANGDVTASLGVGEEAFRQRARVVGNPDGTAGRAYSESRYAYNQGGGTVTGGDEYHLQFNEEYLARKVVGASTSTQVFDRDDFTTYVYRYGLYDANTEDFVKSNGGFGVETATGENGWVDHYGMWFPDHVTITDGQTLTRRSFNGGQDQTYTAVVVPGRLEKRTREAMTLGDIKGEELEVYDPGQQAMMLVKWNGTDLVQVASQSGNGWTFLQSPTSISGSYSAGDWVQLWNASRGDVGMVFPAGALSDSTPVSTWTNTLINGSSSDLAGGNLTLHGYFQMVRDQITSDQANWVTSPYFPDATNVGTGKTYTFNATTLTLELSGSECVLANGVTINSGTPSEWGIFSGPMVATPLTSLSDMGTAATTYNWVTGTRQWNQLRTVKDGEGDWVNFDPPIAMSYTHSEASSPYDNKTFRLEWTGSDLNGVPFSQVPGEDFWVPGFNIPSGTVLTDGTTSYKVKQLEGEQAMNPVANPTAVMAAEGFDLDTTLTAPEDAWQNPHDDAKPAITTAPKFVGGVATSDT